MMSDFEEVLAKELETEASISSATFLHFIAELVAFGCSNVFPQVTGS